MWLALLLSVLAGISPERRPSEPPRRASPARERAYPPVRWRRSLAVGLPSRGFLVRGVELPSEGRHFFTWNPVLRRSPNRAWRRFGTDRLVRMLLTVIRDYATAHPAAARIGVGDLSRPHGGEFGARFGGLGHVSHQNGLDADVYYPRRDRRERSPDSPSQIDRRLARDLVQRFAAAAVTVVFVGPRTGLGRRGRTVQVLAHHDNHLHVRISQPADG